MAFVPAPQFRTGRHSPWGKLDEFRKAFDRIVFTLIDRAEADPGLGERADILALLLRSRLPRQDICDELLTLIGAGHETTASALGWAFERLRATQTCWPNWSERLMRGQRLPSGHNFGGAAVAHGHRCGWPPCQCAELRPRRVADSAPSHGAREHCRSARESEISPTPSGSIRIASATPNHRHQLGWRSAAERGGAPALISRLPKWISCCGRCCRTSGSRPMPPPMKSRISGESPTPRNSAAA